MGLRLPAQADRSSMKEKIPLAEKLEKIDLLVVHSVEGLGRAEAPVVGVVGEGGLSEGAEEEGVGHSEGVTVEGEEEGVGEEREEVEAPLLPSVAEAEEMEGIKMYETQVHHITSFSIID